MLLCTPGGRVMDLAGDRLARVEGRTARLRRCVWGEGPASVGGGPAREAAPLCVGWRAGWRERRAGRRGCAVVCGADDRLPPSHQAAKPPANQLHAKPPAKPA